MKPVLIALAVLSCLAGCAPKGPSSVSDDVEKPIPDKKADLKPAAWPTDIKIHRDKDGKVVCGVMGDEIASPEKAFSHTDYKGERYYFCCGSCPDQFKKDPEKYADHTKDPVDPVKLAG